MDGRRAGGLDAAGDAAERADDRDRRLRASTPARCRPRPARARPGQLRERRPELTRRRVRPRHLRCRHGCRRRRRDTRASRPSAKLLSLDVINDQGQATVADVDRGLRLDPQEQGRPTTSGSRTSRCTAASPGSLFFDPLDQAVEKLWLNGVVVVAAAGNYATNGQESGVPFAPGNDPFVITVGAADIQNTIPTSDDVSAPWSAWGYTPDGFMKPDISAPGPLPDRAGLARHRPGSRGGRTTSSPPATWN